MVIPKEDVILNQTQTQSKYLVALDYSLFSKSSWIKTVVVVYLMN